MQTSSYAVVTGASSGIGLELARQFSTHGFDLLICSSSAAIHEAATDLRQGGRVVDVVQADLATYDGVEKLVEVIRGSGRAVDAVAINAGVGVNGDFRQTSLADELNLIALNVVAPVHLAKRLLPAMCNRGQGRVLFTASIAATMPGTYTAVYAASKAFVLSLSEALRNEVKDTGVTVTALMPGPTETNFFHRAGMDDTYVGASKKDDPADVARQGFEALMAGKDSIIAGSLKTRVLGAMNEVLPETVKAEQHRRMAKPGSAQKHD